MADRVQCDACRKWKDKTEFLDVPGGEHYEHLGFQHVCRLCQVKHKKCTGSCQRVLPATREYFYNKPNGLHGLYAACIRCRAEQAATYYTDIRVPRKKQRRKKIG